MTAGPAGPAEAPSSHRVRDNIRGSSLLTVGRIFAVGVNFVVHVLVVRYLSQVDYGALAYALSMASVGSSVAVFGMNKTMARFVPIYEEHGEHGRMFGAMAVGLGIMALLSLGILAAFYALQGSLGSLLVESGLALAVLAIVIILVPLQTFDSAMLGLFAIFGSARHIFWRRHVFAPVLSLVITAGVVVAGLDVLALGLSLYVGLLFGVLRRRGLLARFSLSSLRFPVREMLGFSLPLLSTDVVFMLRGSVLVILVGSLAGVSEVALFSAVAPIAGQNTLVLDSFRLLFMPAASRLYARNDDQGINHLYWQSAVWVVIATLPILLVSVSLARPVSVFLFGDDYAESAGVLAVLAIGYYVNSAFGHNGLTLRVFGRVRYLVTVDVTTAILGVAASIPMIMAWGAMGGAIGVTIIFVVQNALYQVGLGRLTAVSGFAMEYLPMYLGVPVAAGGLLLVQFLLDPPLWIGLGLAAAVSLAYLVANRRYLRVADMFPELARLPVIRFLVR